MHQHLTNQLPSQQQPSHSSLSKKKTPSSSNGSSSSSTQPSPYTNGIDHPSPTPYTPDSYPLPPHSFFPSSSSIKTSSSSNPSSSDRPHLQVFSPVREFSLSSSFPSVTTTTVSSNFPPTTHPITATTPSSSKSNTNKHLTSPYVSPPTPPQFSSSSSSSSSPKSPTIYPSILTPSFPKRTSDAFTNESVKGLEQVIQFPSTLTPLPSSSSTRNFQPSSSPPLSLFVSTTSYAPPPPVTVSPSLTQPMDPRVFSEHVVLNALETKFLEHTEVIRNDLQNIHLEILRQFEFQRMEMEVMYQRHLGIMKDMVLENEKLKKEVLRLRGHYGSSS